MYYTMECLRENGKYTPEFGSFDLDDVVFEMDVYREDGETVRMTANPSHDAYAESGAGVNARVNAELADWLLAELLRND